MKTLQVLLRAFSWAPVLAVGVACTLAACVNLSSISGESKQPIPEGAPRGLRGFQKPLYEWKVSFPTNVHVCIYQDAYQGRSKYGKTETAVFAVATYTAWDKGCDRSMTEVMQAAPACRHNLDSIAGHITQKYGGDGWRLISSGYFDRRTSEYSQVRGESTNRQRDFWSADSGVDYKFGCDTELTDF